MPRKPTKSQSVKYNVFISHSSKDQFIAETIAEKIEALGATVWVDTKNLEGGGITVQEIIDAIDACNEAIVIVSPDSIKSQWVPFEVGVIRTKSKRITPILYGANLNDMEPLKDITAIALNNLNRFLTQLKSRIKQQG